MPAPQRSSPVPLPSFSLSDTDDSKLHLSKMWRLAQSEVLTTHMLGLWPGKCQVQATPTLLEPS